MAHDRRFLGAFIDGGVRHRLLGVDLEPFSLWHLLMLQAIDSPFLRKGVATPRDLRTAIGICRLRFPDSRIVRPWAIWWPRRARRVGDAFQRYAGDYLYLPDFKVDVAQGAPKGRGPAPEVLSLFSDLFDWGCWPQGEADVWNLPLGRAHWYRPMALRAKGEPISFKTEQDRKWEAALRAHAAAEAATKAAAAA